jgi:hypothetical protein
MFLLVLQHNLTLVHSPLLESGGNTRTKKYCNSRRGEKVDFFFLPLIERGRREGRWRRSIIFPFVARGRASSAPFHFLHHMASPAYPASSDGVELSNGALLEIKVLVLYNEETKEELEQNWRTLD